MLTAMGLMDRNILLLMGCVEANPGPPRAVPQAAPPDPLFQAERDVPTWLAERAAARAMALHIAEEAMRRCHDEFALELRQMIARHEFVRDKFMSCKSDHAGDYIVDEGGQVIPASVVAQILETPTHLEFTRITWDYVRRRPKRYALLLVLYVLAVLYALAFYSAVFIVDRYEPSNFWDGVKTWWVNDDSVGRATDYVTFAVPCWETWICYEQVACENTIRDADLSIHVPWWFSGSAELRYYWYKSRDVWCPTSYYSTSADPTPEYGIIMYIVMAFWLFVLRPKRVRSFNPGPFIDIKTRVKLMGRCRRITFNVKRKGYVLPYSDGRPATARREAVESIRVLGELHVQVGAYNLLEEVDPWFTNQSKQMEVDLTLLEDCLCYPSEAGLEPFKRNLNIVKKNITRARNILYRSEDSSDVVPQTLELAELILSNASSNSAFTSAF